MNTHISILRRIGSIVLPSIALVFLFLAPRQVSSADPKCQVCDNKGKKPKTLNIKCSDVDKYLAKHPGSYSGQCHAVSGEKPPKPKP